MEKNNNNYTNKTQFKSDLKKLEVDILRPSMVIRTLLNKIKAHLIK